MARLVFRVVRECLANVVRHARATAATVTLGSYAGGGGGGGGGGSVGSGGRGGEGDRIVVEVADDGRGFDARALSTPAQGHIGIPLIVDAVETAGGTLAVRSVAGEGTRWRLELPGSALR